MISLVDKDDVQYQSRKRKPSSKDKKDGSREKSKTEKHKTKPVKSIKSIKEIKDDVKNSNYKTGSIKHNLDIYKGLNLNKFFWDYNEVLNKIIRDIWDTIEWKEWKIEKTKYEDIPYFQYNQKRLYPHYRKDSLFKSDIRDHYLNKYKGGWKYSAHWVNSTVDVAFSILDSWKKNYNKGQRKRNCPVAKRLFVRVKQTLMSIDQVDEVVDKDTCEIITKDMLRISIRPRQFIYIDLSNRYFKINGKIGEPILTPTHIHLPIRQPDNENNVKNKTTDIQKIGWDLNKFSMDGFSPEQGWMKIDLKDLYTKHVSYDNKRRRIQKIASKKKVVGKRLKEKYSKREKNICNQIVHEKTNIAKELGTKNGFEDLNKFGMQKLKKGRRGKKWNRWINHINWKQITDQMDYKSNIELVNPYHTSKDCSRCGCTNKDPKRDKFECVNKDCGLVIDRQFNAAVNIYLEMEGLSHNIQWFDDIVIKSLNNVNEFTQTGAERKETNELVRSLYDTMKPQFYGVKNHDNRNIKMVL